jgi:dTDP-3-amino-2,3,6-trideoxy-4-keto-D-glucose/dTDP-3-amino-3,4,6-trideoxy-alpha-D-glucose/dTDP-2,6-dideoxy-D-kanosamine transaminase
VQQINDLSIKLLKYQAEIQEVIARVVHSGRLILGPEVERFEQAFASFLGSQNCVGLANGTDAIEIALMAMGVQAGDLVATAANAGMYTTTALLALGAKPWFMDVDLLSHGVSEEQVALAIQSGAKAVVVTHLYGLGLPEIAAISRCCRDRGVPLLEDCAQAHGAIVGGERVGTFGDAASFSFYPTKNLGALGDGGAVITDDPALAQRIRQIRQYGWAKKYHVEIAKGRNSRLDEIQAACLSLFLPDLDASNERRRAIAERYRIGIDHRDVQLPPARGIEYVAHLYVIRSERRTSLREHLATCGIGSDVHYPIPDHRQSIMSPVFDTVWLPNTELLAQEVLTLPCYAEMNDDQVDRVIAAVNQW